MDKISYTTTKTHYLFGRKIWQTVETFVQVDEEDYNPPQVQKVYLKEEYYDAEFNLDDKEE